jgi:hypothetical protein
MRPETTVSRLNKERRGRIVDYPVVGYTLPVEAKGDVFKEGFNLRLLEEIAWSTGGAINSGPKRSKKRNIPRLR